MAEHPDPGVRVPDERLDIIEKWLESHTHWPWPSSVADLAALVQDLRDARADNQQLREALSASPVQCGCASTCGDDGDTEGPGTCKGLPRAPEPPLVEIVLVHRSEEPRA